MLDSLLFSWISWVIRHPRSVLAGLTIITIAAGFIAIDRFSMNSDTSRLIRQDADWKRVNDDFNQSFPQYFQNSFVVLTGKKIATLTSVTHALANSLTEDTQVFKTVYSPSASDFAERHALLYLELDTLNDTVTNLADAQPFLLAIASDSTLRSTLTLLKKAFSGEAELPSGIKQLSASLERVANQAIEADQRPVSWRDEIIRIEGDRTFYQVIFIQGKQEFGKDLPNALLINTLEDAIAAFEHPSKSDVEIRISGQVPLEHGELVSAMASVQFAGSLALVILVIVLVLGVRSARIIVATYLAMIAGLVWTAAFAMLTVGQYNTISIAFLVMFIGLGVDFAIHLCLKYQESLFRQSKQAALCQTGVEICADIMLFGFTTAIGFLAFVPTEYIGLAEMGIISGGGMIIAVVVSLTLIPAFFAVVKNPQAATRLPFADFLSRTLLKRSRALAYGTLGLGVLLTIIGTRASFDYSTLSLKDPNSEAMTTLAELHREDIMTDYALNYIASDLAEAESIKQALLQLDEVSDVRTPHDYLPGQQEAKLSMLEDARFMLGSIFYTEISTAPLTDEELQRSLYEVADAIARYSQESTQETPPQPDILQSINELGLAFRDLAAGTSQQRQLFNQLILLPLQKEVGWLQTALSVDAVTIETLPVDLSERLFTFDERVLVSITPAENVVPVEAMRRFTESVMSVVPEATGRPVLDLKIGDIVLMAFAQAIGLAVTSIFIVLLLATRSFVDSILVFIPLFMTAMMTLTVSVLIDLPLNMANVVVIPLIFGLGVDNGIHVVKRFHQSDDIVALINSSTPRAVFLSNLTTLGTFCALSLSTHQGIHSIGLLLTVALSCLMMLTLVSLPALLATFSRRSSV